MDETILPLTHENFGEVLTSMSDGVIDEIIAKVTEQRKHLTEEEQVSQKEDVHQKVR